MRMHVCVLQVFRARWQGEVIAVKLVPFMSLVAQHHNASISLVSAAVGPTDAAAAAGGQLQSHQLSYVAGDASQLSGMRLGVQFSSASLRAIKVEIRVLSQLSHPHIVAFKGACIAPPHICILEEVSLWLRAPNNLKAFSTLPLIRLTVLQDFKFVKTCKCVICICTPALATTGCSYSNLHW